MANSEQFPKHLSVRLRSCHLVKLAESRRVDELVRERSRAPAGRVFADCNASIHVSRNRVLLFSINGNAVARSFAQQLTRKSPGRSWRAASVDSALPPRRAYRNSIHSRGVEAIRNLHVRLIAPAELRLGRSGGCRGARGRSESDSDG